MAMGDEYDVELKLPGLLKLKKLELGIDYNDDYFYLTIDSFKQILQNNPALESLTLSINTAWYDVYDEINGVMMVIAEHLKNLQELDLMGCCFEASISTELWQIPDESIDMIADALKHLRVLKLPISLQPIGLVRQLGLKCKNMKELALDCVGYKGSGSSDPIIEAISFFQNLEVLDIAYQPVDEAVQCVFERLPKLRHLRIPMYKFDSPPPSKENIFPLLLKCQTLETITISVEPNQRMGPINEQFFTEFNDIMQKPNGKIEFKDYDGNTIGFVSKEKVVWRNKLMHWIGYESKYSLSNLNLLDLANQATASENEQRRPFDLILDYLDLGSLHSLSEASKRSKALVESYVKRHSQKHGMFTITDEFNGDGNGLDAFAEHVQSVKLYIFEENFIANLTGNDKIFPQVRHLVVDFFHGTYLGDYICIHFDDFCEAFCLYPELETFETKTHFCWQSFLYSLKGQPLNPRNLKKFTFKCADEYEVKSIREIFTNTKTELIPIK